MILLPGVVQKRKDYSTEPVKLKVTLISDMVS